jgi:hypothetical protein
MYIARHELGGFDWLPAGEKCRIILETVRLFVFVDRLELAKLDLPSIYEVGLRYAFQPAVDEWLDVARMLQTGQASCNSLAAWRVAELQNAGVDARPFVRTQTVQREDGSVLDVFHVMVWRPSDPPPFQWEDPSVALGMPGPVVPPPTDPHTGRPIMTG